MKTKLLNLWRWSMRHLPEAALLFFLISLTPAALLGAKEAVRVAGRISASPLGFMRSTVANPWPAAATVTCIAGGALLVFVLWRNWLCIWAVARKMILEAFHRKVVIVLLIFLVVLMPSLPFLLKTEGSLKSDVQIVLLYSLVLSLVLLSLLAIFVTTASICSEVERRHVHITDTKPLPRWQFLLGKWFGVVVMCTAVLYAMAGAAYLLVRHIARPPDYATMALADALKARDEHQQLANEVFTARRSVTAPVPDVSDQVEAEVERRLQLGQRIYAVNSFRQATTKEFLSQKLSVRPGGMRRWDFSGLDATKGGWIHVRFKAYPRGLSAVYGRWFAARRQTVIPKGEGGQPEDRYVPVGVPLYAPDAGWRGNSSHEFRLPASYIGEDGNLSLFYHNADPRVRITGSVTFDVDEVVEVLQAEEGFFPNYYRSLLVILFHVSLLAALGLMAGSLFSFPVAALVVSCLFIGGLIGPWFAQFVEPNIHLNLTPSMDKLDKLWRGFAAVILAVMPNFGSFSPLGHLVSGRLVTWAHVARAGAVLLFVKGGAALLIGMYFYARRELARIIV